jgi:hypothetical protein
MRRLNIILRNSIQCVCLLFCLFILISCSNDSELKGIWIGDYQLSSNNGEISKYPHNILLDFSNDSVTTKILQYWASKPGSNIKLAKESYSIVGNTLTIDSTQAKILIESDSLVISYRNNDHDSFVFRRIANQNGYKQEVDLVNRAFSITGLEPFDSIDFLNDSIYIDIYNDSNNIGRIDRWTTTQYGPYSFLLIDEIFMPTILIKESSANNASFTGLFIKEFDINLTPIVQPIDTTGLNGEWFYPPKNAPPPPMFEIGDSLKFRTYLTIKNDSLEIKKHRSTFKTPLYLNSTGEYIWLGTFDRRSLWKIINIEDNLLTVGKSSRTSRGYPTIQFQVFERIKAAD